MKTVVKVNSIFKNENRQMLLLENQSYIDCNLEKEKEYVIEIKETKSARTIQQNKYMWALLHEIDIARNGERSNSEFDIYLEALEKAGSKFEYLLVVPEAERFLKENFRAVKLVSVVNLKGKKFHNYKCYYGSSKMSTKEMKLLIDTVLDMAEECGINTEHYLEFLQ